MPRYIDDIYIQRRVVTFVACELGEDAADTYKGSGSRTRLEPLLKQAKKAICPTVSTRALKKWWYFFS